MHRDFFDEFLMSHDTLQVYESNRLIFSSMKDRILLLLEYIEQFPYHQQVVIFAK